MQVTRCPALNVYLLGELGVSGLLLAFELLENAVGGDGILIIL